MLYAIKAKPPPGFNNFFSKKIERWVHEPNLTMSIIHLDFINLLRSLKINMPYATAESKGTNPKKNVKRHRHNRYFYVTDIKKYYHNIKTEILAHALCFFNPVWADEEKNILLFLQRYFFVAGEKSPKTIFNPNRKPKKLSVKGILPTGANASPLLANIYGHFCLDMTLGPFCLQRGITYTRYMDDLTFSSKQPIGAKTRKKIRLLISAYDLVINHAKTKVWDLKVNGPLEITGITLHYGGKMSASRKQKRIIVGLAYQWKKKKPLSDEQENLFEVIQGKLGYIKHVASTISGQLDRTELKARQAGKTTRIWRRHMQNNY